MLNILPTKLKKDLQIEYAKRRAIAWLVGLCIVEISFLIFLLPGYISLTYGNKSLATELTPYSQTTPVSSTIQTTNAMLKVLVNHLPYAVHPLVANIISLQGSSISLSDIMYAHGVKDTITLQGSASDRASLLAFTKRLEADPHFESVNLPVSSFAKDTNINFSVSMVALLSVTASSSSQ